MKIFLLSVLLVCFINCSKNDPGSTDCMCVSVQNSDSIIVAAKVYFSEKNSQIEYHCAEIETAIASVTNEDGEEICEDLIDIRCTSNNSFALQLADKFKYWDDDLKKRILTDNERKEYFLSKIKNGGNDLLFEFELNDKKEIISINKLK